MFFNPNKTIYRRNSQFRNPVKYFRALQIELVKCGIFFTKLFFDIIKLVKTLQTAKL